MNDVKRLLDETRTGLSADIDDVYGLHQSSNEPLLCAVLQTALDAAVVGKRVEAGEYVQVMHQTDPAPRFSLYVSPGARLVDWGWREGELSLVYITNGGAAEERTYLLLPAGTTAPQECYYIGHIGASVLVEVAV